MCCLAGSHRQHTLSPISPILARPPHAHTETYTHARISKDACTAEGGRQTESYPPLLQKRKGCNGCYALAFPLRSENHASVLALSGPAHSRQRSHIVHSPAFMCICPAYCVLQLLFWLGDPTLRLVHVHIHNSHTNTLCTFINKIVE